MQAKRTDNRVHVILHGLLAPGNLRSDPPGGHIRNHGLTPADYRFLSTVDPTVSDRVYETWQWGLLLRLADRNLATVATAFDSLDFVAVSRKPLTLLGRPYGVQEVRAGTDGAAFELSDVGVRFAAAVLRRDARNRMTFANAIRSDTDLVDELTDLLPGGTPLLDEATRFVADMQTSGAMTFEMATASTVV